MLRLSSPDAIRHFIRHTLGCACPDEIFRTFEVRSSVRLSSVVVVDRAIIVGSRLLAYVLEAGTEGCIEEHLPLLVKTGREERDRKGLNRFRLVLTSDEPEILRRAAERLFGELRGSDARIHLHLINRSESPFPPAGAEEYGSGEA